MLREYTPSYNIAVPKSRILSPNFGFPCLQLVLEYVVGGDLYQLLREGKGLNEGLLRDVFVGIASGIAYCHK